MKQRDRYADVGAATRQLIERAIDTAEGRELTRYARTLLAAIHWTSTRSLLGDDVYLPQLTNIARIAGDVDGKHTADALHLAHDRGVLIWVPSQEHGRKSWVGLPGSRPQQLPIVSPVEGGPLTVPSAALSGPPDEKFPEKDPVAVAVAQDQGAAVDEANSTRIRDLVEKSLARSAAA